MTCERCQEFLSEFLDGTMLGEERVALGAHLGQCFDCAQVQNDLTSILTAARETAQAVVSPPNPRALWLRIANTIEGENSAIAANAAMASQSQGSSKTERKRHGFWTRLLNARWQLSLPQMAAAITGVVAVVSLITTLGVRSIQTGVTPKVFPKVIDGGSVAGSSETLAQFNKHRAAIDFLKQRVEKRKTYWNSRMREAFDRNMVVIDQTVNDQMQELQQNPHDEIAEQMLDAAMSEKMELLKEFSEY